MLAGIELVRDRHTMKRAVETADQVMVESLLRGLSFKTSQGSFIPLSPPLNISREELDTAMDILEAALDVVARQAPRHGQEPEPPDSGAWDKHVLQPRFECPERTSHMPCRTAVNLIHPIWSAFG
jgi:hypothetical protein